MKKSLALGTGFLAAIELMIAPTQLVLASSTYTITVPANVSCVNTNINVSGGQLVEFLAVGLATHGYEGGVVNGTPQTNPDGDRFLNGANIGKGNGLSTRGLLYSGPVGALIGKVGPNGKYFFIGAGNQLFMPQSGQLYMCYNDSIFYDNTGYYRVTVTAD